MIMHWCSNVSSGYCHHDYTSNRIMILRGLRSFEDISPPDPNKIGGAAQRERSASATTYCARLPVAKPALHLPARARGCRRRSGRSKEGLSGDSGRFAAVARASGGQEVTQRGHRCLVQRGPRGG
jgi:hypothetical protein